MARYILILWLIAHYIEAQSQTDSVQKLNEVVVRAYFSEQPMLRLPASLSVLDKTQLRYQPSHTLVTALNSTPGLRMEERSPGSYRLSIRGSLLRSPFGIRNVKVYLDEFPLTDPGGNTYLNLIDAASVNRIEILKGPEGSVFGANSGGVIVINPTVKSSDSNSASAVISGGSYGLFQERILLQKKWNNYQIKAGQAFQRSDGYRQNSALRRNFFDLSQQWKYSESAQIRALMLYSDLNYRTPGGLTAMQMQQNPRLARPATASLPGAIDQKAGVENKTLFGGIVNEINLKKNFRHVIALFGSDTDFENPFITNYEVRRENTIGLRTYLEYKSNTNHAVLRWQLGGEGGHTSLKIANFDNNRGQRSETQSSDHLKAKYAFLFTHFSAETGRWYFETAASLNYYQYNYRRLFPAIEPWRNKRFDVQLMPRFAVSYQLVENLAWRISASRGYSPPTIAEVRSSNNIVNTDLQPENGWSFETGLRYNSPDNLFYMDAVAFRYRLKDAIVRRLNENDAEYFINAGGTDQFGLEAQLYTWLLAPRPTGFLKGLQLSNSITYNDFSFSNYQVNTANYSGNRLTGVPKYVVVTGLNIQLPLNLYLFIQHNYTSSIPLDDGNTVFSEPYNLMQIKAGWSNKENKKITFEAFGGIDNLLSQSYSLGNDINAVGGRYFNPAPKRNFYFGISASWK